MRVIGITGPSGSGKTALTQRLATLGVPTVDADELYHSMLVPPSKCLDAIRDSFGDTVFRADGSLDRSALSQVVFGDSQRLSLLNSTVLGIVLDEIRNIIALLESRGHDTVAVDAPTLIESGFNTECDTVISVIAPRNVRIERIMARDGISHKAATARIDAQPDDAFYKNASDFVILNDGDEEAFTKEVLCLIQTLNLTRGEIK